MAFDPQAYLAEKAKSAGANPAPSASGFDPKAYLASKAQQSPSQAPSADQSAPQTTFTEETQYDPMTGVPITSTAVGPARSGITDKIAKGLETVASLPVSYATGVARPVAAVAQIGSRALGNKGGLADQTVGALDTLSGGLKQATGNPFYLNSIAEFGGELTNPLTRATLSGNILRRGVAGAGQGLLQTVDPNASNEEFWHEKRGQATAGAALGAILPPAINKALNVGSRVVGGAKDLAASALRKGANQADELGGFAEGSVGAAQLRANTIANKNAETLPVPIKMTQAQSSREANLWRREEDLVKNNPVEARILEATKADQQNKIAQNFDFVADRIGETQGAKAGGDLYETGLSLKAGLAKREADLTKAYQDQYELARQSPEAQKLIPLTKLINFIENHTPTTREKLAPILDVIKEQVERNSDKAKNFEMRIIDTEELVQTINKLTGGATDNNARLGREMKKIIDDLTKGEGGEAFQLARKLRFDYAKEIDERKIVADLLHERSGYRFDEKIGNEHAFDFIVRQPKDDIAHLVKQLEQAGPEGAQALADLRQQIVLYIKDQVFKGAGRDIDRNPIASSAAFDKVMRDFDKGGKLKLLLGGEDESILRQLQGVVKDLNVPVPGGNPSGTGGAVARLLRSNPVTAPFFNAADSAKAREQARHAVANDPKEMAKVLRKVQRMNREDRNYIEELLKQ